MTGVWDWSLQAQGPRFKEINLRSFTKLPFPRPQPPSVPPLENCRSTSRRCWRPRAQELRPFAGKRNGLLWRGVRYCGNLILTRRETSVCRVYLRSFPCLMVSRKGEALGVRRREASLSLTHSFAHSLTHPSLTQAGAPARERYDA